MGTPGTQGEHRILCGVDGSEHARRAAIAALDLAGRLGARLTLVHVTPTATVMPVEVVPPDVDPQAYARSAERAAADADEAFSSLATDVPPSAADREVRLGQPAAVLSELAAEQGAGYLVVGSRGRGALRSVVLGSVSSELARRAPCPVIIVPEGAAVERSGA